MPPQMNYKYEKKHFSFCNQVALKQAGSATETRLNAEHLFITWLALIMHGQLEKTLAPRL